MRLFSWKNAQFFPFNIEIILTDNGAEFTNRFLKKACNKPSLFYKMCVKYGIEHRLTRPYTPKTNVIVERANGIIKSTTIICNKYDNRSEMSSGIMAFLFYYNNYRRHGSLQKELGVKTPFEALKKRHELEPSIFISASDG